MHDRYLVIENEPVPDEDKPVSVLRPTKPICECCVDSSIQPESPCSTKE